MRPLAAAGGFLSGVAELSLMGVWGCRDMMGWALGGAGWGWEFNKREHRKTERRTSWYSILNIDVWRV